MRPRDSLGLHGPPGIAPASDANPVGATSRAVRVIQRRTEPVTGSVRVVEQGPSDELQRGGRHSLGEFLREPAPGGGVVWSVKGSTCPAVMRPDGDERRRQPSAHRQ
jgi:hypothetical protein